MPPDAPLISVSDHLYEVPEMFAEWPQGLAEDAPRVVDIPGGEAWRFGDRVVPLSRFRVHDHEDPTSPRRAACVEEIPLELRDPRARLSAMDRDDVQTHVLFPQSLGFAGEQLLRLPTAAARAEACRAYNRYVQERYCALAPQRLVHVAVVPMADPRAAAGELEECVRRGSRGVSLPCNPQALGLPSWHESEHWDPLLDVATEAGIPVFLHIGTMGAADFDYPSHHGSTPGGPMGALLTLANLDAMTAVVELAYSPVLVKHPHIRLVALEAGCAWLPYLLERIDFFWSNRGDLGRGPGTVRGMPPSELIGPALMLGFIDDAAGIRIRHEVGVERMMWMSDFPHGDGPWPRSRAHVDAMLGDVPANEATAIAGGNAAKLLRL